MEDLLKNKYTPYVIASIAVIVTFILTKKKYYNSFMDNDIVKREDLISNILTLQKINGGSIGLLGDTNSYTRNELVNQIQTQLSNIPK